MDRKNMETTPIIDYKPSYGAEKPVLLNASSSVKDAKLNLINVSYTVRTKQGPWYTGACCKPKIKKKVLKNIDLSFSSGELTAIIGSSGCGKTSLLDVIACRSNGELSGDIYFKNYICSKELMTTCTSYVIQADRLLSHLTVRETLRYTAYLCLSGKTSPAAIEKMVERTIREIGLIKVADSMVGGAVIRGLSGGEKRRLSIAIQLLKDPEILILDEPTTGLDSFTARYLVKNIKDLACAGKIVLLTIHQPRSDIFNYFDQVAILCQGELTYFGRADEIVAHFTRLNFPCPVYANPLDTYIDVCSIDRRSKKQEEDSTIRVQDLILAYRDSPQHDAMVASMTDSLKTPKYINFTNTLLYGSGPGYFRSIYAITHRMFKNLYRDKPSFWIRLLGNSINMMFVVCILGQLGTSQQSIQDRSGLFFQTTLSSMIGGFLNTIFLFPTMRDLFYRESRDGFYSSPKFLLAHIIHTFPFHVIATSIFTSMTYWICGLYSDFSIFCEFYVVHLVLSLIMETVTVLTLGLVFNEQLVNMFISMSITFVQIISTATFRVPSQFPEAIKWMSYATPLRYIMEIIVGNEYSNVNITCDPNETRMPCYFRTSEDYLEENYPHAVENHDENYGWMFLIYFLCLVLAFLIFKLKPLPNLS